MKNNFFFFKKNYYLDAFSNKKNTLKTNQYFNTDALKN